jgi:beta-lactamase class A
LRAALLIGLLLGAACRVPAPDALPTAVSPTATSSAPPATPTPVVATTAEVTQPAGTAAPPVADVTSTPLFDGPLSAACGQLLPAVPPQPAPTVTELSVDGAGRAALQRAVPAAAWPALERLLDAPGTVGLAAYQLGQADAGVYLNADAPMPLASVVKLITLVAYAEAVAGGELDPQQPVALADLDRFYLPRFDLGAHQRAVNDLRTAGRVSTGDNPSVALEDVAWMMVRYSSNAASDYLHDRLGQMRIEQTARDLGLLSQTAPCPFIGQFLLMGNHTRQTSDTAALRAYLEGDPARSGADVSLLADAYTNSAAFREAEAAWRQRTRRPSIESQRAFSESLNAQGSAADYAALMARLAQNGLSSGESSYTARRILEWPMQFPANQELFSNAGYKNGSLPGILTTAYYAYRWNDAAPVVVVLFYRDLPQQTYRQWRWDLPHDELARWLLSDPAAIPLLRAALAP